MLKYWLILIWQVNGFIAGIVFLGALVTVVTAAIISLLNTLKSNRKD